MAYKVIRTIKGRQYAYMQTSYREGGKVRTAYEYIGAIDPINTMTRTRVTQALDGTNEQQQEIKKNVGEILDIPSESESEKPSLPLPSSEPKRLNFKIKTEKYISETRLQNEFQKALKNLERAKVITTYFGCVPPSQDGIAFNCMKYY